MKFSRFVFFALFVLTIGNVFGEECAVAGTVVDQNRRPVANAEVIAYTPPAGWEDLIVLNKADEQGSFEVKLPCKSSQTHLFAAPPLDRANNFYPVQAPYWIDNKAYRNIFPRKLPPVKNGVYNVGQIVAPVYRKVEITFLDEAGNPLLPADLSPEFWLNVKTADGYPVSSGTLGADSRKNAKSPGTSALTMILPAGKWIVELNPEGEKGKLLYPDRLVDLENLPSGEIQKVILKMSRRKARLKP